MCGLCLCYAGLLQASWEARSYHSCPGRRYAGPLRVDDMQAVPTIGGLFQLRPVAVSQVLGGRPLCAGLHSVD